MSTATRETFAGLGPVAKALWYVLSIFSTGVFAYGVFRLVRRVRAGGAGEPLRFRPGRAVRVVLTHAWIGKRNGTIGLAHAAVFYGFCVLLAGTTILAIQDDVVGPLGWTFWRGAFYQGYSLFLDVWGFALAVGVGYFAVRRGLLRPSRLKTYPGDWRFLLLLGFLALTGFLLEALRIAVDRPSFEVWSPVGWVAGNALRSVGLEGADAEAVRHVTWWIHGLVALAFTASIPFTKAVHLLAGPVGVAVRDDRPGPRLPAEPETGYAVPADLSPRHRIDVEACTRCGRCHEVCPAQASGYPLSPRDLVLDLRADTPIAAETLWSCMQCMACVEICPVGVEHVPMINLLRRGLVEKGEVEDGVQGVLEAVYTSGNSFGEAKRKRARWAKDLDFEVPDARGREVDVLWFVGDYASFDPRNQRNTKALARLLTAAGVDFGILFDAEKTAGNDVRRIGEEGLYRSLVEENIATIAGCSYERILTSDPHSFNTLRNEYPTLGAPWTSEQVVHHSQLLLELLESGALTVSTPLGTRATYHDPCTLGRYNGIFEQPRDVLRRVGIDLVDMPRNRANSFCCGAGGGRIWMLDKGTERPSESRIREALGLDGVELFIVACPKDVTMYEDAIKTTGNGDRIRLRELSELVAEAVGLDAPAAAAPAAAE
jgi:Fe-S oxidoreductase/nitrate reductase gamma subunit